MNDAETRVLARTAVVLLLASMGRYAWEARRAGPPMLAEAPDEGPALLAESRRLAAENEARAKPLAPDERDVTPRLRQDIRQRSLEIAFSAPLKRELQALEDMKALCREATLFRPRSCRAFERLRLHRIALWEEVEDAAGANPANLSWPFVNRLSDAGSAAAGRWRAPDVPAAAGG